MRKVKYIGNLGGIKIATNGGTLKVKRGEVFELDEKDWGRCNATGDFKLVKSEKEKEEKKRRNK